MRILHLNTNDAKGGAARAAHRLHTGLRRLGQDSTMLVLRRSSDDPHVRQATPSPGPLAWMRRMLRERRIARDFERYRATRQADLVVFSDDRSPLAGEIARELPPCDVVHLHWVRKFIDLSAFLATNRAPMVWTLHDMNPFTGGCHYDEQCGRFRERCGRCPQLGSNDDADLSRQIWQRKQSALERIDPRRLRIAALCRWMAKAVESSSLLGRFAVSIIPNGLDTEVFAPRERSEARAQLGLPAQGRLLLFVAESLRNKWKGFAHLLEALRGLKPTDNIALASIGRGRPETPSGLPHFHLGEIHDDRLLAAAYSAADLFVIPSVQENLPNTVMESLACGTPVAGFDVGGIPDMVRPGLTGALAPMGDAAALQKVITNLLSDSTALAKMSAHCREVAVKEYALEVQTRRYTALYEELLAANS